MTVVLAFLKAYGAQLAIGALILFALWRVDQNGYSRAKKQAEAAEVARQQMESRINHQIEVSVAAGVRQIEDKLHTDIAAIDTTDHAVTTALEKEIVNDPSLSKPGALPPGVLDQLNRARRAGHPATSH